MNDKEQNFVSAVIYVHNAEERIGSFLKNIILVLDENFENSEVICVNDSSDDDGVEVIRRVCEEADNTSISVVNMSYFHGLELAMNAGMDLAIGDYVFEFDNTVLDFEPNVIMQIYRRSLEGYDIVSASPERSEKSSSRMFYKMFERFSDKSGKMCTESFRILSRRVINRISATSKSILYRKALYANCGLKTDNVKYPVTCKENLKTDKKEKKYRSSLAVDSLILYTGFGYRFSMTMTFFMMVISLCVIAYTIITYFMANPVEGWTTTILLISFCFFSLFGILTIIIKYLQLIINMVFKRKHYSYESIEKMTK